MANKRAFILLLAISLGLPAFVVGQITPADITMGSFQQQRFQLLGYSQVTWSILPAQGMGTIDQTGLYTAPDLSSYKSEGVLYIYAQPASGPQFSTIVFLNPSYTPPLPPPPVTSSPSPVSDPSPSPSPAPLAPIAPLNITISLSPANASLQAGQSATFTATVQGTNNQLVQWSLSPNVGTLNGGTYTAPSSITSDTQVTITATSEADSTKMASSTVMLTPPVAPPPPVSISLTPSSATLTAGQSTQFSPTVSGTTNTTVSWSLAPNVGTIANGLYNAPATIGSQQTIVVTATSQADTTKTASASLILKPVSNPASPPSLSVAVTLSPSTASLNGGQSATFTPTVTGSSNTAVTWSLTPQVGTLTNGVYKAPAIIASQQTITITAQSVADPTKSASVTVLLIPIAVTVGPSFVSLSAGMSATFSASVTGSSNSGVTWSLTPSLGTIVNGVYTAPATVSSAQNVSITAISVVDTTKTGSATVSLTLTPANTNVTLPIEVMGAAGTTASVSFSLPNGTSLSAPASLWLQIHGLKYDSEASVQVNNSGWLPLSTGNVTLLGLAATYGGIGGGFHTLQMTLNLPSGTLVAGTNTIAFRFNGTDGVTSGFRVLGFNIASGGTNLLPSSLFVQDDPDNWQPPSTAASDISAGQTLWHTAALTVPGSNGPIGIQAHCADCHSEDGRDLKYFNYSNNTIETRSIFHGLTSQQGAQIASYIRSLNVPNPGRPWNPPYQPGPGLDSQPVTNWSAGAGLDAMLDSDADMQQYMLPGGSSAGWAANAYLNVRELPIPLQLPDWNSWLPVVHPIDAYGASFTSSELYSYYLQLHSMLQPNSAASYQNAVPYFYDWFIGYAKFLPPLLIDVTWTATLRTQVYSLALWRLVKQWELNQEFGLEGMPQVPYGSKADVRGWLLNAAFSTSPNMLQMTPGPGLGNGSNAEQSYLAYIWYHMQLILNDGQGTESGNAPLDFSYTEGAVKELSINTGNSPGASLELMWLIKSLQEYTLNGLGPQYGSGTGGFVPTASLPLALVFNEINEWTGTSLATQAALTTDYVTAWFAQISTYTPQEFYAGSNGGGGTWASPTENPATDSPITFGAGVWYMLPRLRYIGVDPALVNQITAWAATIWPLGNWTLNNSATCTSLYFCTSD